MFARFRISNEKEFNAVYKMILEISSETPFFLLHSECLDQTERFQFERVAVSGPEALITAENLKDKMLDLCSGNKDHFTKSLFYLTFNNYK